MSRSGGYRRSKRTVAHGHQFLRSYNDLAGRNGSWRCGDATMLRDNPAGSSSRCSAAREVLLPRCTLAGESHRTIDPHALKIPARRAEYSLTENAASPFHAEPRHGTLFKSSSTAPRSAAFEPRNPATNRDPRPASASGTAHASDRSEPESTLSTTSERNGI
jgi:hypothetical protein